MTYVEVPAWRASLLERASTFSDTRAAALAGDSDESCRLRVTAGRLQKVRGDAWTRVFDGLSKSTGQWSSSLPREWRERVSPEDDSHVTAVFFPPDEAPFSELALAPGKTLFVEREPDAMTLLEVVHVPAGVGEGDVTTSRFFKSRWTLPVSVARPFRGDAKKLAGLALAALVASLVMRMSAPASSPTPDGVRPDNPRRRSAWRSLWIAAILLGTCFIPAFVEMDMMNGGYALIFVAGVGMLSAFVVALWFFASARRLDRLLGGDELFAHWVYPPEQWQRFADVEYGLEVADKRALFRFVAAIIFVVTAAFVLFAHDEASLFVAGVMGALVILLWLLATFGPGMQKARHLSAPPEAWIGPAGVLIGGTFHDFVMVAGHVDHAEVIDVGGALVLEITYTYVSRTGVSFATARAPVPNDDAREAARVAAMFAQG